jgi:hypothetical protein
MMKIPHTALEAEQAGAINPASGLLTHNEVRNSRLLPGIVGDFCCVLAEAQDQRTVLPADSSRSKEESLCREIKG